MVDFSRRSQQAELMDGAGIAFAEFHHCLRGLETINRLTLAYRPTLKWLRAMLKHGERLSILDAGCGGGDMLRRVAALARRRRCDVSLLGVDMNPWSKQSAELAPARGIRYETADIFSIKPDTPIDIIICSLFTHHLDDVELLAFLRWLDRSAVKGWFINDLHRHPLPYYFIKYATRIFSGNRLIRHDAAVSVARSFTAADWRRLLASAGTSGRLKVEWFFPFRLCVSCLKT
jgi:2-polyprenyl-3-methyl-5-hydroxy-6-metoxy-1,4-benzoquinol methylase